MKACLGPNRWRSRTVLSSYDGLTGPMLRHTGQAKMKSLPRASAGIRGALHRRVCVTFFLRPRNNGAPVARGERGRFDCATCDNSSAGCEAQLKERNSAELAWWTFPGHRRRGLATRGVQLMLLYLRELTKVRSFIAFVEPDNLASLGVARKVGFTVATDAASDGRRMVRLELVASGRGDLAQHTTSEEQRMPARRPDESACGCRAPNTANSLCRTLSRRMQHVTDLLHDLVHTRCGWRRFGVHRDHRTFQFERAPMLVH